MEQTNTTKHWVITFRGNILRRDRQRGYYPELTGDSEVGFHLS